MLLSNHNAITQCIKSCKYRSSNVHSKHQNGEKSVMSVTGVVVGARVFHKLLSSYRVVQETKNTECGIVLWVEMPWGQRKMSRLVWAASMSVVTQIITLYNYDEQKTILACTKEWALRWIIDSKAGDDTVFYKNRKKQIIWWFMSFAATHNI